MRVLIVGLSLFAATSALAQQSTPGEQALGTKADAGDSERIELQRQPDNGASRTCQGAGADQGTGSEA